MDNIQTSETPDVSTGTADSPSASAESSVSTEANQTAQPIAEAQSVSTETSAQPSTATPEEFPSEEALAGMSGQERSSHWQQVRSRIDELNRQIAERDAQLAQRQQPDDANWVKPDLLFAPKIDPRTGQPFVNEFGEPITTPTPFLQQLRAESPNTFGDMVWEAMNQPWSEDESTARVLFRDYYGLNPDLLDTYRQIQSPEDAQAYQSPPVDMSHIPQTYHDLYKSLDWETRDLIDSLPDDASRNLVLRGLNAEFQQKHAQQAQQREIAKERQRIQMERSAQLGEEIGNGARQLVRQQFERSVQLTGEPETDKLLWEVMLSYGENQLLRDPQGKAVIEKLYGDKGLINSGETYLARSQQALIAANAARLIKQPLEEFSKLASDARKWRESQRQNAVPRAEIGATGSNGFGQPSVSKNGLQQSNGRNALFNEEEIAQLAAQTRAALGG